MPAPGTKNRFGETWDGSQWQAGAAASPESQEPGIMRFLEGAAKTSPLNPMNLVRAIAHPIDTLGNLVATPMAEAAKAAGHYSDAVTGNDPNGRLMALLQGIEHTGGAVPLIGKAGIDAGEKIGNGDIAGGAGELTGLASAALVPKLPRGATKLGGAMERGGNALLTPKVPGTNLPLAGAAALEEGARGNFGNAAVAASPYALKYGGKALQTVEPALAGLQEAVGKVRTKFGTPPEPPPEVTPADIMRENVQGARDDVGVGFSRPVAAKLNGVPQSTALPSMPDEAINPDLFPYQKDALAGLRQAADEGVHFSTKAEADAASPAPLSPIDQFYLDNPQAKGAFDDPFQAGRTTGNNFSAVPGHSVTDSSGETVYPMPNDDIDLSGELAKLSSPKTPKRGGATNSVGRLLLQE